MDGGRPLPKLLDSVYDPDYQWRNDQKAVLVIEYGKVGVSSEDGDEEPWNHKNQRSLVQQREKTGQRQENQPISRFLWNNHQDIQGTNGVGLRRQRDESGGGVDCDEKPVFQNERQRSRDKKRECYANALVQLVISEELAIVGEVERDELESHEEDENVDGLLDQSHEDEESDRLVVLLGHIEVVGGEESERHEGFFVDIIEIGHYDGWDQQVQSGDYQRSSSIVEYEARELVCRD